MTEQSSTSSWTARPVRSNTSLGLVAFLVLVVGGGALIGAFTGPDAWYANLPKPSINPPGWVFGPVWTVLYVLVAVAGWRAWRRPGKGVLQGIWWLQLGLNFAWSPLFFVVHRIDLALVVIVLLMVAILAFMVVASRQDRVSVGLFLPYAMWVGFAAVLNGAFFVLNGAS